MRSSEGHRAATAKTSELGMITGLPAYKPPIHQTLRCVCSRYYLVYLGARSEFDSQAYDVAREDAERRGCTFVDARATPFMNCSCGQPLDFTAEESARVM
jgi:hypothetical protein